jgi:hypothetical protein
MAALLATRGGFVEAAHPPMQARLRHVQAGVRRLDVRVEMADRYTIVDELVDAAVAESEMSIDPLWTSITTNMLRLAMACVCCLWLYASPSSASRNPRFAI